MLDSRPRTASAVGGLAADAVVVLGVLLLLGVVGGLAWAQLVDPVPVGATAEDVLARQFDVEGWYAVLAAVAGVVAGAGLTVWRSRDPVATVLLLLVGAGLAAAVMAWVGAALSDLEVVAHAAYVVWPTAALFGSVVVLWSRPSSPVQTQ